MLSGGIIYSNQAANTRGQPKAALAVREQVHDGARQRALFRFQREETAIAVTPQSALAKSQPEIAGPVFRHRGQVAFTRQAFLRHEVMVKLSRGSLPSGDTGFFCPGIDPNPEIAARVFKNSIRFIGHQTVLIGVNRGWLTAVEFLDSLNSRIAKQLLGSDDPPVTLTVAERYVRVP